MEGRWSNQKQKEICEENKAENEKSGDEKKAVRD